MDDRDAIAADMGRVPGMAAAERRLARLGVEFVDMTWCDHGHGATAEARVGRAHQKFTVHAASSPLAAVDELCEQVERARRMNRGQRRRT